MHPWTYPRKDARTHTHTGTSSVATVCCQWRTLLRLMIFSKSVKQTLTRRSKLIVRVLVFTVLSCWPCVLSGKVSPTCVSVILLHWQKVLIQWEFTNMSYSIDWKWYLLIEHCHTSSGKPALFSYFNRSWVDNVRLPDYSNGQTQKENTHQVHNSGKSGEITIKTKKKASITKCNSIKRTGFMTVWV